MESLKLPSRVSPARTGVWVGIATITMSFAAYTSAMVVRQGAGSDWQHIALPPILYLNTLLLLLSSGTLEAGRRKLEAEWRAAPARSGPAPSGRGWIRLTLGLGLLFLVGQVIAWRALAAQGLVLASGPSSAFFYLLTVLHAVHLLGGLIGLAFVLGKLRLAGPVSALGAAVLYWHFMAVLWLYLLLVLVSRL